MQTSAGRHSRTTQIKRAFHLAGQAFVWAVILNSLFLCAAFVYAGLHALTLSLPLTSRLAALVLVLAGSALMAWQARFIHKGRATFWDDSRTRAARRAAQAKSGGRP